MESNEILGKIRKETLVEFTDHIIPFWKSMIDRENGGFYGKMDYSLKLDKLSPKGCILHSRILWFFSKALITTKDQSLREYADHAYKFIRDKCIDREHSGIYWSINADGTIADSTKHTYNQAFTVYALSAYHDATGNMEALDLAWKIHDIIETKCRDETGYMEAFTRDFKPESNEKLSENGVMAEKTMNTLLHVFEAYTELYRITGDENLRKTLYAIIRQWKDKIWNPKLERQEVFFDRNFNSIIDLYSYGHDIETSWLVDRCLDILNDEELTREIHPITTRIAEKILQIAYRDSSLMNECDKGIVSTKRIWWVQAEGVVGFINAYEKTMDKKFLDAADSIWEYIKEFQIDRRSGSEWYNEIDENHKPIESELILGPWKCPYHNGRMCMEMQDRISR
ncbi:MAG: AGE family epimerase/isomerase [Spirochaetia bacterium]|nr:AGE family epimerase/isomerase [Spirochaetia bacterium]